MNTGAESSAEEVTRVRGCLNDLVSLLAVAGLRTGDDPPQIVSSLQDALLGMLRLAFVFVRLNDLDGGASVEMLRVADALEGTARGRAIREAIDSSLSAAPLKWPSHGRVSTGGADLYVASAHLGLQGEIGIVVAGSQSPDFPRDTDRLLLDVAASQAVIGLQQARLLREAAERKRVEEALRERERASRLIVDSIPGLVATLTPAGEVEGVNNQVLAYCGRTLDELKQWGSSDTVHPEDLPRVIEVITQSLGSGDPYEIEERIRRFDGVYRWFQVQGLPLRDSNGRIVRWHVLLTDIDARKRAEEALRKSERQFRLLVETIPALVWRGTPEGELDYLNHRAVEFLGRTAESLSGGRWLELVHPDQRDATVRRWLHSTTTGSSYEDVYQIRRVDGQYRWIRSLGEPFREPDGRIAHWYGLVVDIEDRKRAEDELRRSEAFLAEGLRISSTGTFSWCLDTDEITLSAELRRIYELDQHAAPTVEELFGRIHPDDIPMLVEKREQIRANQTPYEHDLRLRMPDGRVKYLRTFGHVMRRQDGRLESLGATQDVTQRRLAEEALDKARSELAHVTRVMSLGALTASIAHEVNQPLSGIITNASTCLRFLDADPPNVDGARETARRTIRDGNRAADVISRLRALFSRKEFVLESVDLNEVTREIIALSLSDLQRNRVVLQSELADDLPRVTGDRIQLQQVVLNLLRNASDAMNGVDDRPRHLLIRTERETGDGVRVTVRDAGVGLDPQNMDTLFDAFYTTKIGGMGIGLSVSRSIVERHHGRLWAEANDGPGSTFMFSIPRSPESVRVSIDTIVQ
jgi:PAS domain S-box-containing protein